MLILLGVLFWGNCTFFWYSQVWGSSHESRSSTSIYLPLSSYQLPVSQSLISWRLSGPVVPESAWKAKKSLVLELGSEIILGWCWWGLPFTTCLQLLHMLALAAHPHCWLGHLFPVYYLLTPHTHGPPLFPSCRSDSTFRLVRNGPLKPASFLGQTACLTTVHKIFPYLLSWGSVGKLFWPLSLLGLVF